MVWFRERWDEEVLRQLKLALTKCQAVAFENRGAGKLHFFSLTQFFFGFSSLCHSFISSHRCRVVTELTPGPLVEEHDEVVSISHVS